MDTKFTRQKTPHPHWHVVLEARHYLLFFFVSYIFRNRYRVYLVETNSWCFIFLFNFFFKHWRHRSSFKRIRESNILYMDLKSERYLYLVYFRIEPFYDRQKRDQDVWHIFTSDMVLIFFFSKQCYVGYEDVWHVFTICTTRFFYSKQCTLSYLDLDNSRCFVCWRRRYFIKAGALDDYV